VRLANFVVFDDYVVGTASTYSSSELNRTLGEFSTWNLQVIVDNPQNAATITVQLETSVDGRNWTSKNATPEVDAESIGQGTTVRAGRDTGTTGFNAGLVRLRVALTATSGTPIARVKIWLRGGDQRSEFVPTDFQGCTLWLRADLGVTVVSGKVSRWEDQSGNGNHVTQGNASSRPTFVANSAISANRPGLTFSGSQNIDAASALFTGAARRSMLVVYKPSTTATALDICGQSGTSGTSQWFMLDARTNGDPYLATWANDIIGPAIDTTAKWALGTYDGTTMTLYKNGVSVGNPLTVTLNTNNETFRIGAGYNAGLIEFFQGDIGEVVVFNRALNATEIARMKMYITTYWSL
jgi:hypothetical protein